MTRTSNLESWINVAKLGATAGELAPFSYIKGVFGCAVLVLEAIERAGKNNDDLLDLADSIGKTIEIVQNTVTEHGESSALRFLDVCAELEVYLTDLTFELNSTRRKSRGIKRFLKAKNVSDAITGYRERVRTIKEDFLIHTAVDSRLVISDIKDGLKTSTEALTSAIETSQRHTISNTHKNTDRICEEIRTWGVLQSKKADKLSADVQTLKEGGSDKVRDVRRWEIYVKEHLASSCLFKGPNSFARLDTYSAEVDNSNAPKIVRVYRSHHDSNKLDDVMKQFHIDIDRLINLEHPRVAQIYGVCRSPDFPAVILHGTTRDPVRRHCASLTVIQLLHFNTQLFDDLESASDYLGRLYHTSPHGWTDHVNDLNLSYIYINEQGRIMFAGFSFRYYINSFTIEIVRNRKVHSKVILTYIHEKFPDNLYPRDWNSLMCRSPSLEKKHLLDIYDSLHILMGSRISSPCDHDMYSSGNVFGTTTQHFRTDYLVVGTIPVVPTEQAVTWVCELTNDDLIPFSGSLTMQSLSLQRHCISIIPEDPYWSGLYTRSRRMMHSLFAQASRLSSSSSQDLRDIDRRMHDMKYVEVLFSWPVSFDLYIRPCYDPFQLLDTFMADSDYALALSITISEPHLDPQSNTVSWPVIHWYCDLELSNEISVEEAEVLFGIKVEFTAGGHVYQVPKTQLSTIVEINTMCGFDPALEGADICEYFNFPRMEIFNEDPVKYPPTRKIKQIALPAPVHDRKDTTDATPVTHIRAEKEPSNSRTQSQLIGILIALNVLLLSLVIHYSIKV